MKLVIGNKNYSSWSLRPWMLLKAFGIDFEEIKIGLYQPDTASRLREYSPSMKVPVLIDADLVIWDSVAICEYISEARLNGQGWPESIADRAIGRSVTAEMHSGFFALRNEMPMNVRLSKPLDVSEAAKKEIVRIVQIWGGLREKYQANGDWLFGRFSIADCMFAPVALRFKSYQVELPAMAEAYKQRLLSDPAMTDWIAQALLETEVIPSVEV
jgi:glutathione S-transferase